MSSEEQIQSTRSKARHIWKIVALTTVLAVLSTVGVAAANGYDFKVKGGGQGNAMVRCGGGMSRLGHTFNEAIVVFEGDPEVIIDTIFTVAGEGFLLENVSTGTHASTHLDAPIHFIEGGRSIDQFDATEFVWPAYVIDVRERMQEEGPDFQLTKADIRDYEKDYGKIREGSMVIIQTGFETKFGTEAFINDSFPGFSADAVQWLFDKRWIGGLGSDTVGPDASSDGDFSATYTALLNDGLTMPGLNRLDTLNRKGDIIIASAVALENGSGYQVDPLACHGF